MITERKMRDLPSCAYCGGVAVLKNGAESGNYWVECERYWEACAEHTGTYFYPTEDAAVASWRRNVAHDEKWRAGE